MITNGDSIISRRDPLSVGHNWKRSKKKSRERIDGIVALIMGLERATTQEVSTWYYQTHEFEME